MLGRRITALLLTAFLVAQVVWRWQPGAIAPASSTQGSWTEVASGAYRAYGSLLIPLASGDVLQRTRQGWVQARATWSARLQDVSVHAYGAGGAMQAVAQARGAAWVLPRYDGGFLMLDGRENLWLVAKGRVLSLLGSGSARTAFLRAVGRLKGQGSLPRDWQPVWAANPLAVGGAIWYVSNRDLAAGATPPRVFRLSAGDNEPVAGLDPLGGLHLLGAFGGAVLASDAEGDLLAIDAASGAVLRRWPQRLVLTAGPGGEVLDIDAAAGAATLEVSLDGLQSFVPLALPKGVRATGQAAFSAGGGWLALSCASVRGPLICALNLAKDHGPFAVQLIGPPPGTTFDPALPISVADGLLYVAARQGRLVATWSRPLGRGASLAVARHGLVPGGLRHRQGTGAL